jgi:hypothetical protein
MPILLPTPFPARPAPPPPAAEPAPAPPPPEPFLDDELRAALRSPSRALNLVLAERSRLGRSVAGDGDLRLLIGVLTGCVVLASVPYGLVRGWSSTLSIAWLYGGTLAICWPSLQVFGSFLGQRLHPQQSFAMAMVVAAVGALFTLGFAPIAWFLRATMADGDLVDADTIYVLLLAIGLVAGLVHLTRGMVAGAGRERQLHPLLLIGWQVLVVAIAVRMARVLGLFS